MSGKGAFYKNLYGKGGRNAGGRVNSIQMQTASRTVLPSRGTLEDLSNEARRLEGKPYPAYGDISGVWNSKLFTFFLDYVQSDPYAPPSKARVRVDHQHTQFPADLFGNPTRKLALCDFLTRSIHRTLQSGEGNTPPHYKESLDAKGGSIIIDHPGQHVLQRTCVVINNTFAEVRFAMVLPARGRTILGLQAARLIETDISRIAAALFHSNHDPNILRAFICSVEDQEVLRDLVARAGLSGFVANGAILPRRSGASDAPMSTTQAIPFKSPPRLEKTFCLPHRGEITGMGIPAGITLIAGGGFHGKSTLLNALSHGCYNKIPGDGREFVVTSPRATAIRGEDGRSVTNVNISPFINNLPWNKPTTSFSTGDASGSTSMAAGVVEALELGADTLLLDEDTCATNFLIRDRRMQLLISREHEPITPLIFKIRSLYRDHRCSTVLVVGGCGVFCDVADLVLQMRNYECLDVTEKAREVAKNIPSGVLQQEETKDFGIIRHRTLSLKSLMPSGGGKLISSGKIALVGKVISRDIANIQHGEETLNLRGLSQLVHPNQTRAIAACLKVLGLMTRLNSSGVALPDLPLKEELQTLETVWNEESGLDSLFERDRYDGFLARPRLLEVGMAINRLRVANLAYSP